MNGCWVAICCVGTYCLVLCCAVPAFAVLCCPLLSCGVLSWALLCRVMLCCSVLCVAVLCCFVRRQPCVPFFRLFVCSKRFCCCAPFFRLCVGAPQFLLLRSIVSFVSSPRGFQHISSSCLAYHSFTHIPLTDFTSTAVGRCCRRSFVSLIFFCCSSFFSWIMYM